MLQEGFATETVLQYGFATEAVLQDGIATETVLQEGFATETVLQEGLATPHEPRFGGSNPKKLERLFQNGTTSILKLTQISLTTNSLVEAV